MTAESKSCRQIPGLFWSIALASLAPWLFIRIQQATNSDILWLCEALRRIFSGATMVEAAYEQNPPLCMLIYTLPVLANTILHVPLHYAVFIQTLILVALSTLAVYALLRKSGLFKSNFINILTFAYLLMNTYGTYLFFGERDHMIALGLVPFVLLQAAITLNWPVPRYLKFPILFLGTILILVKPHHGLIPALMIAHRGLRQRNLNVLCDADFLALACGSILYPVATFYFFPDYFTTILPDVIRLYLPFGHWFRVGAIILTCVISCTALIIGIVNTPAKTNEKKIGLWLIICGLLSLIPYEVQGFGFYYHLIPALVFSGMGFAVALFIWLKAVSPNVNPAIICAVIMSILSLLHAPLITKYPTHANYKNLALPKLLANECPKDRPCSFFMTNLNMAIIHEASYYSGIPLTSRFSSLWFQAGMMQEKPDQKDFEKFSAMVIDDLIKGKPDILVLVRDKNNPRKNFIPYFSRNKDFVRAIQPYKKIKTLKMSYDEYYRGSGESKDIYDYDIYKRTAP